MQLSLNYSAIGDFYPNPQLFFFSFFFFFPRGGWVWAVAESEARSLVHARQVLYS